MLNSIVNIIKSFYLKHLHMFIFTIAVGAISLIMGSVILFYIMRYVNPSGDGVCRLTPVEGFDETKFLEHYLNGTNHWRHEEFEKARNEFEQALILDRNFPGLNQMIADSSLKLKEYDDAEAALNKEFELLRCLDSMTDDELQKYATGINPKSRLRKELDLIRASSLYHMACIYSFRKETQLALDTLRLAIQLGYDKKELTCPELEFIRAESDVFQF